MSIHNILNSIQKELNVPKERFNSFAKYNYRNCEDIVEGVKRVLPEGAFFTLSDDIKLIGDRYYVEATATLYYMDKEIAVKAYAREPLEKKGSDASQITGASSSYARKYALNGLFAIDDNEDSDSSHKHETHAKPVPIASKKESLILEGRLLTLFNDLNMYHGQGDMLSAYQILQSMTKEDKQAIAKHCVPDVIAWFTKIAQNPPKAEEGKFKGQEYARV